MLAVQCSSLSLRGFVIATKSLCYPGKVPLYRRVDSSVKSCAPCDSLPLCIRLMGDARGLNRGESAPKLVIE